jgi:hypothetical protein
MTDADQQLAAVTRPAQTEPGDVPWARQGARKTGVPVTGRVRRLVQGLPSWDPLPPGEILVRRRSHDEEP